MAVAVFTMINAGPIRPTGGVAGATGTPAPSDGSSGLGLPGSSGGPVAVGGGGKFLSGPTPEPTTGAPGPTPRPTTPPTAAPTPARTAQPTPRPTHAPPPTPTPDPTTCVAPRLVGQHWNSVAKIWHDAGFTGAVTRLAGKGNYLIATQNRVAGRAYPCVSTVTVGP
jgi:hypothetical protein